MSPEHERQFVGLLREAADLLDPSHTARAERVERDLVAARKLARLWRDRAHRAGWKP